jgi:hypothetical protein
MRSTRALWFGIPLAASVALLATAVAEGAKPGTPLDHVALCGPDRNTFSSTVTNPYFPLPAGQQWVYLGRDQGEWIGLQITVEGEKKLYPGRTSVTTRIVEELEWVDANQNGVVDEDEDLIEISRNFFAQTPAGTVCYFGEEVDIYEDGRVVSHEGAWRADDPGNAPGIFMPADPQVGMTYQQEVAPGVAEDTATIVRRGDYTVPAGTFGDTITVRDFNPLDGSRSTKVYARGVGLIADDALSLTRY